MAFGDLYSAGSASIDAGSPGAPRTVVGHGTLWSAAILAGDTFEAGGCRVTIEEVVSNTELTLAYDWPEATLDHASYVIRADSGLRHDPTEMTSRVRDLLERLQIFDSASPIYSVEKFAVSEPPIDGIIGDYGVVAATGATGQFTGKENQIYLIQESGYYFFPPEPGWQVFDSENLLPYYWSGLAWQRPVQPYHLPIWVAGKPTAGEVIYDMSVPQPLRFLAGMANSVGRARNPSTGTVAFSVRKNDVEFATVTFNSGDPVPVITSSVLTEFVAGDVLTVLAPASQDDSLANLNFTLVGKL